MGPQATAITNATCPADSVSAESSSVLDGKLVLDLSTMIAGPVCARTLGEYGAEVIKIASPRPLHGPRMVCWFGIDVDQGKRSLLIDVATEQGNRVLRHLVQRADVLVHNFSRSAASHLHLTVNELLRINPHLVVCRVGAIEGPEPGPWDNRKAYDPVLQAASGIMLRYGNPKQPEHHGLASCIDYVTGYCAGLGAALALFKRARDPKSSGGEAVTSLAQGAHLAQTPFAFDFRGRRWTESSGQQCLGDSPLHRLYRAHDGWLFLAARSDKCDAVLAAVGFGWPRIAAPSHSDLARLLESALRKKTCAYWQEVLRPLRRQLRKIGDRCEELGSILEDPKKFFDELIEELTEDLGSVPDTLKGIQGFGDLDLSAAGTAALPAAGDGWRDRLSSWLSGMWSFVRGAVK